MITAPSSSATMTSSGKIAQPPHPIGSFQPTKVNWLTEAGAATPAHQTGRPVPRTPCLSRMTPSVMSAVTPRLEIGFDQLSGVARSSRTGTKRSVNAGPTTRFPEKPNGIAPAIQECRMPFFSNIVVMVPVVTFCRISIDEAMISLSSSLKPDPLVASTHIHDEGNREQNHPEFANDLADQELERAEGQPQKYDRVDNQPDNARRNHSHDEPSARERRIDGEIRKLRQQEGGRRGHDQCRRREAGRDRRTDNDRADADLHAKPALNQISQNKRQAA